MPAAHSIPAGSPSPGLDDIRIVEPLCAVFRRKLRDLGLKYTPERARILDLIIQRDGVFEAEGLLQSMRAGGELVSKATVYRTIKLLADAGIIQRVMLDQEHASYQLAYGRRSSGLLVNLDTRQVVEFDAPELAPLRDRLCDQAGLVPEGHRLVIYARNR